VFERIWTSRFEWYAEAQGLFNPQQAGFRKGRNCSDFLGTVTGHILRGFAGRHYTAVVFAEVAGAYDTVHSGILLQRLRDMGWPPKVLRLLAALLLSRKIYATYDGRVIGPRQGLAQGSVLSPILYMLYTSGISRNLPQAVTSLKFTDDETLLARGPDLSTVLRTLQDGLQILADNLREGGAYLSPTKSTLCIFTRRRVPAVRDRIILDRIPLPESTEARCLGLIFDSKLTWNAHIRHVK